MNIQLKYLALIVLVSAVVGAAITRIYATREVIKTQTVEKVVTVDRDVVKDHNIIVTKEIINKDGSKEIDTTRTDDRTDIDVKKVTDNKQTTTIDFKPSAQKQWFVAGGAGLNLSEGLGSLSNPVYHGEVNRRILGPAYLGGWTNFGGNSKTQVGVQLGWEF